MPTGSSYGYGMSLGCDITNQAFIDHDLIESRILPWMAYKYEVEGLLFWTFDLLRWSPKTPFLINLPNTECGAIGSGDGMLWYMNIPSVRLAAFADGYEDHQYLSICSQQAKILSELSKSAEGQQKEELVALAAASRGLSQVPEAVVTDLTHYCRVGDALLNHRREMARQIVANNQALTAASSAASSE